MNYLVKVIMPISVGGLSTFKYHTQKPYLISPPVLTHSNMHNVRLTFGVMNVS